MKNPLCILLISLCSILTFGARGEMAYCVETVPNVYATNRTLHVSDPSAILSASTTTEINRMLTQLEDSTGIQSLVVMLPSIGHEDIFEFSHSLFKHLGIGNKETNNGFLILYVADQRKIRFTTGYGLEGHLPDAICKRIQERYMIPHFREGNTDMGMLEGVKAVVAVLDGSMEVSDAQGEDISGLELIFTLLLILGMIVVPIWLIHRQKHTCPRCHKAGSLKLISQSTHKLSRTRTSIKQTLLCSACGHTVHREHINDSGDLDGMAGGMFMGSMLGGRGGSRGGGGFMGGSFGGGRSGGGGATSGW